MEVGVTRLGVCTYLLLEKNPWPYEIFAWFPGIRFRFVRGSWIE